MNDAAGKIPFKEVAERLYKEMVEREYEGEPLESKATAYLNYVLQRERIRRDAMVAGQRQDAVDYETLVTLKSADSDDPQHAHAMLAFQRLGVDPIKAVEYVERLITSRQTEISQKMTDIASNQRPKGRKPFANIIDEIVRQNPSISRNSLLQKMKNHEEISVIDDIIICREPHDEMPVSGLSEALRRSKKRLLKIKHSRLRR
jgi:hypothetical protein